MSKHTFLDESIDFGCLPKSKKRFVTKKLPVQAGRDWVTKAQELHTDITGPDGATHEKMMEVLEHISIYDPTLSAWADEIKTQLSNSDALQILAVLIEENDPTVMLGRDQEADQAEIFKLISLLPPEAATAAIEKMMNVGMLKMQETEEQTS